MKVHYINILMFALLLNILVTLCHVSYPINPCTTLHTQINKPIKVHRLLCECELYGPKYYDNNPEMKKVMENFDRQTSQRFEEYNERMIKNRKKCKDQCDKDVQKIVLKDKIEKKLTEKLSTLQTDISTNEIPTCVCENSLADKVEKTCLRCTQNLGGIVAPSSGVLGGIAELGLSVWKPEALITAKELAAKAGAAKGLAEGIKEGIEAVMDVLNSDFGLSTQGVQKMGLVLDAQSYKDSQFIYEALYTKFKESSCISSRSLVRISEADQSFCTSVIQKSLGSGTNAQNGASIDVVLKESAESMVSQAKTAAEMAAETATQEATTLAIKTNTAAVDATYASFQTVIIASIVAILVIVLVMVIIYLILRYRRKKKIKKKLKYIKLLKE
ncbi:PIR protein, putative [Plasmodium sp.]|nr:PIR protein, putative [Plasmodium sp.]